MATYGIMRIEKRTRSAVYGLQIEANRKEADQYKRDFFDSDIDWSRTKNNVFIKQTENWNREITRQIKEAGLKERKNSIVTNIPILSKTKYQLNASSLLLARSHKWCV